MIKEISSELLDKFIKSDDMKYNPVPICHFFMEITGEVIFRAFFGEN